ncbi:unnamed protein product [Rotaria sp. Silwood2]|nr:unnamed protein product [Rotaria sp. Silwood2]
MSCVSSDSIFIIVYGLLSENDMIAMLNMPQVRAIYLCSGGVQNPNYHEDRKIRGVFSDSDMLAYQVRCDMASFQTITDDFTVFQPNNTDQSTRELSKENAWFISFHYLLEIIFRLPESDDDKSKQEIVDYCQEHYGNNDTERKIIDEFNLEYAAEKALWWYTRESFLYRLLNRSLRSNDTMRILTCRVIIKHMHQQIVALHRQLESQNAAEMVVYRGQIMSIAEVEKLENKINSLISINTFFSTSTNRQVALQYMSRSSRPHFQPVLFTIRLTASPKVQPYAYLSSVSAYSQEHEVLLSVGSVFKIDGVEKIEDNIWNIYMTLSGEQDKEIEKAISHLKAGIGESSSLLTFAGFLLDRGEYVNVEKICTIMDASLPNNDPELAVVYNNWGGVYFWLGDYETALQYYIAAYHINGLHLSTASADSIATTDSNIATIYFKMRDFSSAISYLEDALRFRLESEKIDYAHVVKLYSQMALTYSELGDQEQADDNIQKASDMAETKDLPKKHSSYGWLKMSQAILFLKASLNDNYFTLFKEALQAFHDSLPVHHPDLITVCLAIGDYYQQSGQYQLASEHYTKALDICYKALPNNHPDIEKCQRKIKLVSKK